MFVFQVLKVNFVNILCEVFLERKQSVFPPWVWLDRTGSLRVVVVDHLESNTAQGLLPGACTNQRRTCREEARPPAT